MSRFGDAMYALAASVGFVHRERDEAEDAAQKQLREEQHREMAWRHLGRSMMREAAIAARKEATLVSDHQKLRCLECGGILIVRDIDLPSGPASIVVKTCGSCERETLHAHERNSPEAVLRLLYERQRDAEARIREATQPGGRGMTQEDELQTVRWFDAAFAAVRRAAEHGTWPSLGSIGHYWQSNGRTTYAAVNGKFQQVPVYDRGNVPPGTIIVN